MKTSGTNRRIRVLLTQLRDQTLVPRPEFQRRLVWSHAHKERFLDTVLRGLPFPEIYVAAGTVDPHTGDSVELLVDGQQRLMTLFQYFTGSDDLKAKSIPAYVDLGDAQIEFLNYEVVVRDLGSVTNSEVRDVFERINSTGYALNVMEIHNARYDGQFKQFGEEVADSPFFWAHSVFRPNEIRRMGDLRFALSVVISMMSAYFHRDDALEQYLATYNDEFPRQVEMRSRVDRVFDYVERLNLPLDSRAWQKGDLFTLLVELDRAVESGAAPPPDEYRGRLQAFYSAVDSANSGLGPNWAVTYNKAALQAANDRSNRIRRAEVLASETLGASPWGA